LTSRLHNTLLTYLSTVQDPAYNKPGVPLDRGVYSSFAETFEPPKKMQALDSKIDCGVKDASTMAKQEDCAAAIASGTMHPVVGLMQGKKGGQWWASVSPFIFIFLTV